MGRGSPLPKAVEVRLKELRPIVIAKNYLFTPTPDCRGANDARGLEVPIEDFLLLTGARESLAGGPVTLRY
jgi:hypothetical protein